MNISLTLTFFSLPPFLSHNNFFTGNASGSLQSIPVATPLLLGTLYSCSSSIIPAGAQGPREFNLEANLFWALTSPQ